MLKHGYKIWDVTDLPPLKESHLEIPKPSSREVSRLELGFNGCFSNLVVDTLSCVEDLLLLKI
jgi:hypothetical protein